MFYSISCICYFFDPVSLIFHQLLVLFNALYMLLYRSVVSFFHSVVYGICHFFDQLSFIFDLLLAIHSISCICYFFDQLRLIFDQFLVSFNQVYM